MAKNIRRIFIAAWVLAAITLGFIGFMQCDFNVWGALYHTAQLFFLNVDASYVEDNILIRIAAPMAVVTTATAVLVMVRTIWGYVKVAFCLLIGALPFIKIDSVAVHTDSPEDLISLRRDLGLAAVLSNTSLSFYAKKNLFYYKDSDRMMRCLNEHASFVRPDIKHHYYLCCSDWDCVVPENPYVTVISPEQNCARLYWEDHPTVEAGEVIVMIGFGDYAQALLTQALLVNVISAAKTADYHIFMMNDTEKAAAGTFLDLHRELDKMVSVNTDSDCRDSLFFHDSGLFSQAELLENKMSRVILTTDDDAENISIAGILTRYFSIKNPLHIRVSSAETSALFYTDESDSGKKDSDDKAVIFGTMDESLSKDIIFNDELERRAQLMDADFMMNLDDSDPRKGPFLAAIKKEMPGRERDPEAVIKTQAFKDHWTGYSSFMRLSNYAQADHLTRKIRLLLGEEYEGPGQKNLDRLIESECDKIYPRDEAGLTEKGEMLAEIEHIRWCRLYYMNNWQYGTREEKDNGEKKHPDLRPYSELDKGSDNAAEKDKDRNAFINLAKFL